MDGAANAVLLLEVDLGDLELGEDDLGLDISLRGWVHDVLDLESLHCFVLGWVRHWVRVCLPQWVQEMAFTWPRLARARPLFLRFLVIYGEIIYSLLPANIQYYFNTPNQPLSFPPTSIPPRIPKIILLP